MAKKNGKIKVFFRVTGMYFGAKQSVTKKVSVWVKKNPTVAEVMRAVAKKVRNDNVPGVKSFVFVPFNPTCKEDLSKITIEYTKPPMANRSYDAGVYVLADNNESNPERVFQYYIFDRDMKQRNNNNFTRTFGEQPDSGAEIKHRYTVVWRQVSILTGPTKSCKVKMQSDRVMEAIEDDSEEEDDTDLESDGTK